MIADSSDHRALEEQAHLRVIPPVKGAFRERPRAARLARGALALASLAALLSSACSPGIYLKRFRPAPYNLGTTRRAALLKLDGPSEAAGVIAAELSQQMLRDGWFELYVGPRPEVAPGQGSEGLAAAPAEILLAGQVTRWDHGESVGHESKTENGVKVKHHYRVLNAAVDVNFQVIDSATGRVVAMREYAGRTQGPKVPVRVAQDAMPLLREACALAVASFLRDITPSTALEKMVLDDSDKLLLEGVALCKKGQLDAAMASFQRVLDASKGASAAATYDLAVLYEARGENAKAEELYRKALALQPKDLYRDALSDLQRRMAEDKALMQHL